MLMGMHRFLSSEPNTLFDTKKAWHTVPFWTGSTFFVFAKARLLITQLGSAAAAFSGPQCAPGGLPAPPFLQFDFEFAKNVPGPDSRPCNIQHSTFISRALYGTHPAGPRAAPCVCVCVQNNTPAHGRRALKGLLLDSQCPLFCKKMILQKSAGP